MFKITSQNELESKYECKGVIIGLFLTARSPLIAQLTSYGSRVTHLSTYPPSRFQDR
jgi:hypothetical protein